MTPFFEAVHRRRLVESAESWLGTAFRLHACVKGAGVDCIHLSQAIYLESGFALHVDFPRSYGRGVDALTQWFDESEQFSLDWQRGMDWEPDIDAGDALCFDPEDGLPHLGVAIDPRRFVHCMRDYGVRLHSIQDSTFRDRLAAVYRPIS